MKEAVGQQWTPPDQPLLDATPYGYGKYDSISDATEKAAITHKEIMLNGETVHYTARAGHLVTADQHSALLAAKIFYVSLAANGVDSFKRPVTFFYNGGPRSSSVFLLLGSFGPRRIIDSTSQRVALEAMKFSLATAGIKPAADNVCLNIGLEIRAGYVIDLSEPGQPAEKSVGGVVDTAPKVIDAKPVDPKADQATAQKWKFDNPVCRVDFCR